LRHILERIVGSARIIAPEIDLNPGMSMRDQIVELSCRKAPESANELFVCAR